MIKRPLTPIGVEVKKGIIDPGLTHKAWCERHGIDKARLSTAMRSNEQYQNLLKKACEILDIEYAG